MAEEKEPANSPKAAGKAAGWIKAILGTVAGLCSGAVVMYLSPLIDKVVKPAKPLANFAVDHEGITVTFHNRSAGSHDGWWDFGDGSPLEPLTADQDIATHSYPGPGDYTAKLTVHNLLGDESERVVNLHLDSAHSDPPQILALEVTPVSAGAYAPATFRVTGKVKNAQVCVWDLDDDRPWEVVSDAPGTLDRLVTFDKPGGYVVKLAAINGKEHVEKTEIVSVLDAPAGTLSARLSVAEEATRVDTITVPYVFAEPLPAGTKDEVVKFSRQAAARPGYQITDVRMQTADGQGPRLGDQVEMAVDSSLLKGLSVRALRLQLAGDRRSVRLSGAIDNPAGTGKPKGSAAKLELPVVLVQERRTAAQRPATLVTTTLGVPGSAMLMMPPKPDGWVDVRRQMRLELRDGDRVLWQESQLPRGAAVTVKGRRYQLTATPVGEQLRVDLVEVRPGQPPAAN